MKWIKVKEVLPKRKELVKLKWSDNSTGYGRLERIKDLTFKAYNPKYKRFWCNYTNTPIYWRKIKH
jgi:hypothetical protein